MMNESVYPIGTPGVAWEEKEKSQWLEQQDRKRTYEEDVLSRIEPLKERYDVEQYGVLDYEPATGKNYPLFVVKTRNWSTAKPVVLVTGGVHGYETSGVHGALHFLETVAERYADDFNIVVAPCLSPWGYETINRWNPFTVDPNRSFKQPAPAQETGLLMAYMQSVPGKVLVHIDLHETTDTDNSEFRPALAARDGITNDNWNIPDGFYLVCDSDKAEAGFQKAILDSVAEVTHIAEADEQGKLIGIELAQHGVISLPTGNLGLCMGFTDAQFISTTEVYPDSPRATPEQCVDAQVAAITGGLDYVRRTL